jgi:type IV fimbrial biogenesis protein FimT
MRRLQRAFTVVEILVVLALIAVVLALAAPSFQDLVVLQRLKSINSGLVTDLQFARSEAVSRGKLVYVIFKVPGVGVTMSCYTIYTDPVNTRGQCDCSLSAGARCQPGTTELKTEQIPTSLSVALSLPGGQDLDIAFDSVTGAMVIPPNDFGIVPPAAYVIDTVVDSTRTLRTLVGVSGRPSVCLPTGAQVSGGYTAC